MATRSSPSERLPLSGAGCEHLAALGEPAAPTGDRCAECGAGKVLRVCLTCGHVGCCDSHNGHGTAHARETGHPLIRAWKGGAFAYRYEPGYL
jgi:CPA1 family monovalent cation:H+ antiporter